MPKMKTPGRVDRRYPSQQYKLGSPIARPQHSKAASFAKVFRKAGVPAPVEFYGAEIEGFEARGNGWASGRCPFHDDHSPSFTMHLESGGYKCLSSRCGVAGNSIVSFVCALYDMSRAEAYRYLEARA